MAELATMKFRRRPIVVEAFRFGIDAEPWWWREERISGHYVTQWHGRDKKPICAQIETVGHLHTVHVGDWIIRGAQGQLLPCNEDVFNASYSPLGDRE